MLKKILIIFLVLITFFVYGNAFAGEDNGKIGAIEKALLNVSSGGIVQNTGDDGLNVTLSLFVWIKNSISEMLLFIAVAVFLYIGIKLTSARGNPEEFKKAMVHFIYAVVGIFVVSFAWALVTFISGINI